MLRATADGLCLVQAPACDILVVGDQHITPGQPVEHFEWLAALIRARRPDVIVNIGDVIDMVSLSSHADPVERANTNYVEELRAGVAAWAPAVEAAREVGARLVYCTGNHDDPRVERLLRSNPWLKGAIPSFVSMMEDAGWETHAFQAPVTVGGVAFAHYFVSGTIGRPISGVNVARSMVIKLMDSALAGHSHVFNVVATTTPLGRRVITGNVGCFIHPDSDVSAWAGPQVHVLYDRGVVYLHGAQNGDADVEWVSMERLKALHGEVTRANRPRC